MSFIRACALADVAVGAAVSVDVDGTEIAIVRCDDDAVFAVRDECSHAAIPLSEGEVDTAGCEIECWLHGSRFDLRTGEPTGLPAYEPVPVYPCKVDGDDVVVDVENPLNQHALA
jgi:3-phenylpropionate/trans-cinnamate dioxygenase ferredoxin component